MASNPKKIRALSTKLAVGILHHFDLCACLDNVERLAPRLDPLSRCIDVVAPQWPAFIVAEWGSQLTAVYADGNRAELSVGLHPAVMDPTGVQHVQVPYEDYEPN